MKSQVMHGVIPAPGASKAASGEAEWTGDNPYEVQGSVGAPALLKKLQSVIVEVCLFVCLSVCGARVRQYVNMNAHIRKMHNPARAHTHMHTHTPASIPAGNAATASGTPPLQYHPCSRRTSSFIDAALHAHRER